MVKVQFDVTFPALACSVLSIDAMDISGEQHLDVVCIIRKTCWFNFVLFQFPAWTLKRSNAYELEQFVMCYLSFVFWCTCSETWYNQEKNRFSWQCDRNKARWNWFSHGKFYGYLSLFWRMYYVIHIFYIGQLISAVIRFVFLFIFSLCISYCKPFIKVFTSLTSWNHWQDIFLFWKWNLWMVACLIHFKMQFS